MTIKKSDQVIASLADWERLAPPKSKNHWVDGRSAKEAAKAWLEGMGTSLPVEVASALETHPRFGKVSSWDAEPEARLRFDSFAGEPRNSDLLVVAEDSFGTYVLAVEAKADEPYGETVAKAFAAALERRITNPRSNGVARIERLASQLLPPQVSGTSKAIDLRYQLLSACAGAVAEAERRGVSRAVMLVHEFFTTATKNKNHKRNGSDLRTFLARISDTPVTDLINGKLYGPFTTPGTPGVELFVGKATRYLRPPGP